MLNKKELGILLSAILLLIIFYFVVILPDMVSRDIERVEEGISEDKFSTWDIKKLSTKKGKKFAENALNEYEEMVENYPQPSIEILNEHIFEKDKSYDHTKKYLIETGSNKTDYELRFKLNDIESMEASYSDSSLRSDNEEVIIPDAEGVYVYPIDLYDTEIYATVRGVNKYKEVEFDFLIKRDFTNEEKQQQARIEQENLAWERSKAGVICSKNESWTRKQCNDLAESRYWIGMTYDMLVASRGKPNSANPSNYGSGTKWQWCWNRYSPRCFYDNNDDGLIDSYN